MASDIDPIVGTWYQNLTEKGQRFEVVSVDEDAATVEVQHFDGDIEEWDIDQWYAMDLEVIEAPENWTGPDDIVEEDRRDLTYMESDMSEEEWEEPLHETKSRTRGEDEEEFEGDEWGESRPKGEDEGEEPEAPGPERL